MKKTRCSRCLFGKKAVWPFAWCEIKGRFVLRCGRCVYCVGRRRGERL